MDVDLYSLGISPNDLNLLFNLAQLGYIILSAGLFMNWLKNRHPGVLLSCGLFGCGAYFSYIYYSWWPLLVALAAGHLLKSIGFNMGYH